MKLGLITTCALGLTVALTIGSPASGQTTGTGTDTTARPGTNGATSGSTTARTGRRARRNGMRSDSASMNMNMSTTDTTGRAAMRTSSTDTTGKATRTASTRHHRRRSTNAATSTQRIPVNKESKGEVTAPIDTTPAPPPPPPPAPAPVDTTPTPPPPPPPAPTPAPVDTTTTTAALPPVNLPHIGSFYWSIGGGAALPTGTTKDAYNTGWDAMLALGWDPMGSPIGLRFDGGYGRLMGRNDIGFNNGDLAAWSANADLKLRAPFAGMLSLLDHLYAVGGVGVNRLVGYGNNTTYTVPSGSTYGTATGTNGASYPVYSNSFGNAKTEFGWNAGGGFSFGWGRSALFVESRYFSVNMSNTNGMETHYVPVILGLTFR